MSLFDDIIKGTNTGLSVGGALGLFGGGQPKAPKAFHYPLKDSGEMSAVLDQIWSQWGTQITQLPPDQLLSVANQVRATLYDPTVFQQSGTENDLYLNNSKQSINNAITQLQGQISGTVTAPGVVAMPVTTANNITVGGLTITPNMLLFGGIGVLVIRLLMSEK